MAREILNKDGSPMREYHSEIIKELLNEQPMKKRIYKIKILIATLILGKPKLMSVYKDSNDNYYGSVIHDEDDNSYIHTVHADRQDIEYIGEARIWI